MRSPGLAVLRLRHLRRMVAFGLVSVLATVADLGLFNVLLITDTTPLWASTTLGYTLGMITSYVLNRRYTFDGGRDSRAHEIGVFVAINLVGLLLNNGIVALFVGLIGRGTLTLNVARIIAAGLTWTFKFATIQQWVFPSRAAEPSGEMVDRTPAGETAQPV